MGDPNASIPTPEPVRYRPMFAAFGRAAATTSWTFVSGASLDGGRLPAQLDRALLPVRNTRRIGKKDMALNDALPAIAIDPERYTVTIDGERIAPTAGRGPAAGPALFSVLIADGADGGPDHDRDPDDGARSAARPPDVDAPDGVRFPLELATGRSCVPARYCIR